MFDSLRNSLEKGAEKIVKSVSEKEIKEKDLEEELQAFKISLLKSDVALEVSEKIIELIKKELIGKKLKRREVKEKIFQVIKNTLESIFETEEINLIEEIKQNKPYTMLFLGFNGSGKTSTISKLCYLLKNKGLNCVLSAADTYRAASIEQLQEHANRLDVKLIKHDYGADPAAVVYDSIEYAKSNNKDVVLVDTAGRSHKNVNLMDELKKICRVNEIDLKILVIDSLTGNDAVEQGRDFEEKIGVDGMVLTKMDVNKKGGASISVSHELNKPILYIGKGQNYEDLEKFKTEKILKRILEEY